jgi:hypothetical protein
VISWGEAAYGAVLAGVAAAIAVRLALRERSRAVVVSAGAAAVVGSFAWNAILQDTGGEGFFHDAPIPVFPVSWQDTGSGVFTTAAAALLLGFGALGGASGRRVATAALACGLAALVVDVYLY